MALPADGQNANDLTKVTEIPAGKELIFFDPTTNEGGIITLENLTKQILNGLTKQTFALDAGQQTILQALNTLNSDSLKWQRYAVFDGVIKVKNIYTLANKGEGVLLANISAYNTPSITEQYLYIIGFSADRGDANFHKIVGDGETISSVTCTGNSIVLNLTSGYSSAICRVLFIGN